MNTAPEGTDPVAVKAAIASLTRNTTYHYRLVATNAERAISRGADRTFRTDPGPQAPTVTSTTSRDVTSRTRAAAHARRPERPADHRALRVRAHDELRRVHRPRRRRHGHDAACRSRSRSTGCGRTRATTSAPSPPTTPGTTRSLDRSFRTPREPTGISIALNPSRVVWGRRPDRRRPRQRHGGGRHPGRARAPGLPVPDRLHRGRDEDGEQRGHVQLQRRLAVRDHALPRRHAHRARRSRAASARRRARSRVGIALAQGRPPQGRASRARSGRACPTGRVSLQKRSPRGRWAVVKRAASEAARRQPLALPASRCVKPKRKRPAARYRVVVLARDGGAHVPGRSREVRVAPLRKR